jgi:hypothetical protein
MGTGYPNKAKKGLSPDIFANFGGWCADPEIYPELFNNLPAWRQAEIRETRRVTKENPEARAHAIHDPSTGKPYPNQVLVAELVKEAQSTRRTLPDVPEWFKFSVPHGVPLSFFHTGGVYFTWKTNTSGMDTVLAKLREHVTLEALLRVCTVEGKALTLAKPVDGVYAYVWRLARYCSGCDPSLPVTCLWDLEDGLTKLGLGVDVTTMPEVFKPVFDFLQKKADELLDTSGGDRFVAAMRYARIMGVVR